MPLYEYRCDACGTVFEVIQKFSDEPIQSHDGCGGRVRRLISPPAFQFKGSGWYITDYARKDGGNGSKAGKAANAKAEPASETKIESKSESKPAAADAK